MTKWCPIETAPKDGTLVFILGGQLEEFYENAKEITSPEIGYYSDGHWLSVWSSCCHSIGIENPSSWHPLVFPDCPNPTQTS